MAASLHIDTHFVYINALPLIAKLSFQHFYSSLFKKIKSYKLLNGIKKMIYK